MYSSKARKIKMRRGPLICDPLALTILKKMRRCLRCAQEMRKLIVRRRESQSPQIDIPIHVRRDGLLLLETDAFHISILHLSRKVNGSTFSLFTMFVR